MDLICACIDSQGFYVNNKFVPREIAIVNDEINICIEIDTELSINNLIDCDRKSALFVRNNIHGLTLRPIRAKIGLNVVKLSQLKKFILFYYSKCCSDKKTFFGVRNNQFCALLDSYNIPYIDLNCVESFPTTRYLDETYYFGKIWFCSYHTVIANTNIETKNKMKCSLRKAMYMFKWIKENNFLDCITSL